MIGSRPAPLGALMGHAQVFEEIESVETAERAFKAYHGQSIVIGGHAKGR